MASAGGNGDLTLWDIRGAGSPVPRRFVSSTGAKPVDPRTGRLPLTVTDDYIWTRRGAHVYGYALQEDEPTMVLKGHLGAVHAIAPVADTGQLISSANDGLLLLWGPSVVNNQESTDGTRRVGQQRRSAAGEDVDDW